MPVPLPPNSGVILGLLGSLIACFFAIPFNSKGHKVSGLMLGIFSAMHIYQYRKRLSKHLEEKKMFLSELSSAIKKKIISDFADIEVLYFRPGRIRIYARQVHHNKSNAKTIVNYLTGIKEIKHFSVNPHTGSVLIEYSPEEVAGNKFLRELEDSLRKKYGRR